MYIVQIPQQSSKFNIDINKTRIIAELLIRTN